MAVSGPRGDPPGGGPPRGLNPPLTTIRIPHQAIGMEAAQMLLERLRDPSRHARSVVLPLSLVVRGSTAPASGRRRRRLGRRAG
ncbi:MAG TPA: substrate-binding domain-containing protein [Micromonosporaceae bacterium]